MKKIKIAFIKFAGLSLGGTEKYLQTMAANLNKSVFAVDYYYCDLPTKFIGSAPHGLDTDLSRIGYMREHKVNLIKFKVAAIDLTRYAFPWVDTDFWELFNENKYDIVFTARGGYPEYPFTQIKTVPIVDTIHLTAGVHNQSNIARVIHLCGWNVKQWVKRGGDPRKARVIYQPIKIRKFKKMNFRKKYGLNSKFIFGFHQRNDDSIFSPIPLQAYAKIQTEHNHFVIMNGSRLYQQQAKDLGIKNITFIGFTPDFSAVYNFLEMLDVFAHGRKDGEINSLAIAEAMYFGLPIVSHFSKISNGQVETIDNAGKVVDNYKEYALELAKLEKNKQYYKMRSKNALKRFEKCYDFDNQLQNIEKLLMEVKKNPFPFQAFTLNNLIFELISVPRNLKYLIYTFLIKIKWVLMHQLYLLRNR